MGRRNRELGLRQKRSLWAAISDVFQGGARRVAIVAGAEEISYAGLRRGAKRLAGGPAGGGLRTQDRVLLQLPHVAEFPVVCFALQRLGAVPIMALPAHRQAGAGHFTPGRGTRPACPS